MEFDLASITVADWPDFPRRRVGPRIVAFDCVNCGARFGLPRCRQSPYCTVRCHDQAKVVRYARAKRREHGEQLPWDIRQALRMKLAHALGTGYDATARYIPVSRRREVKERDGGLCVLCGATGEQIDHIDGSSDDLTNLRLLCKACHDAVTERRFRKITDPDALAESYALRRRAYAAEPERPCDAADWNDTWRQWHRAHAIYA